jgi:hypothetical protein
MIDSTCALVVEETSVFPLSTLETVATDTPASRAIDEIVTPFSGGSERASVLVVSIAMESSQSTVCRN